ncbi:MAG: YARHG domain-containing protein, partial [Bacteroidota bacterium]
YPNYEKNIESDAGFYWNRANKINISIDQIKGTMVIGHSVVAGNDRPFEGTVTQSEDGVYNFFVKEPGDHKYDGIFEFTIQDQQLIGTWVAYKNIDISKRKYTLEKKSFAYDPEIMLDYVTDFADWTKSREMQYSEDPNFDDAETWVYTEVASATGKIYEINASNTKLTKKEVENLQKGDLAVIRNTIYARHGYSFKNRPLRVFFDAQPWYVPVHADIKADFTNIEKENIALLLKYEENAAEYYDSFGR